MLYQQKLYKYNIFYIIIKIMNESIFGSKKVNLSSENRLFWCEVVLKKTITRQ